MCATFHCLLGFQISFPNHSSRAPETPVHPRPTSDHPPPIPLPRRSFSFKRSRSSKPVLYGYLGPATPGAEGRFGGRGGFTTTAGPLALHSVGVEYSSSALRVCGFGGGGDPLRITHIVSSPVTQICVSFRTIFLGIMAEGFEDHFFLILNETR